MISVLWTETFIFTRGIVIQIKPIDKNDVITFLAINPIDKVQTNSILTKNENKSDIFLLLPIFDGVLLDGHPKY